MVITYNLPKMQLSVYGSVIAYKEYHYSVDGENM